MPERVFISDFPSRESNARSYRHFEVVLCIEEECVGGVCSKVRDDRGEDGLCSFRVGTLLEEVFVGFFDVEVAVGAFSAWVV